MTKQITVDETDHKILYHLQQNARISFADLAKVLPLSASATRERVQRLHDLGVIKKFGIEIDYKLFGLDLEVFIQIKVFQGQLSNFLTVIKTFNEVKEAYRITGEQNVHLKVLLKGSLQLQSLIDKLMKYGDTTTSVILSKIVF